MSERAADRQTLGELNSALLLTNERETQSLQLIGWVAHPHSAAVLLEVGLNPKEIYLCSSEARPDVARLLPDIDPERIFGFRINIPVSKSHKFSSLLHIYGVMTLSNGEQEAISFAVQRPRQVHVSETQAESAPSSSPTAAAVTELLQQRRLIERPAPSFSARFDSPDLSVIVHGEIEESFLHAQLDALRRLLPQVSAELLHAGNDAAIKPLMTYRGSPGSDGASETLAEVLNRTAARARGKHLLFIGSRGLLQAPAIYKAVSAARGEEQLGALGASIYSPDGQLLERGARIVGDTFAVERNTEHSSTSSYRFRAEVISRHFLLTSKAVFQQLGGFEPSALFDVDYCLRTKERGLHVSVDPSIVHITAESEASWFGDGPARPTEADIQKLSARHAATRRATTKTALPPLFFFVAPESLGLTDHDRLLRISDGAAVLGYSPTLISFGRSAAHNKELLSHVPPTMSTLEMQNPDELFSFLYEHRNSEIVAWLTNGPLVRLFQAAVNDGKYLDSRSTVILDVRGPALDPSLDPECRTPYFLESRLGVPTDCVESTVQMADLIVTSHPQTAQVLAAAGIDENRLLVDNAGHGDLKSTAAALAYARVPRSRPWRYPALRQVDPIGNTRARPLVASEISPIDVVVPIFNAYERTRTCIERVLRNTERPFRLILVDDASTDERLVQYLAALPFQNQPEQLVDLQILRNDRNLGFVGSVNRGLIASRNDAVILNSDTEVPPEWLGRLAQPLAAFPSIGSCTPFSNCATICSFPEMSRANPLPEGITGDEIDAYCRSLPGAAPIEIPTGVGFCMMLRRAALDRTGLFDPLLFGRGYGEENDWCLRASQHGFRHVLVPNLFVAHHEGSSFSVLPDRTAHILSHVARVEAVWPGYSANVQIFEREDPIRETRERLARTIAKSHGPKKGTLYISHIDLGGGSALYLRHRLDRLADEERQFILHIDTTKAVLMLCSAPTASRQEISLSRVSPQWFNRLLEELGIEEVFVNQLVGLDAPAITNLLLSAQVPFTFFVHDYFAACPSVNLLNARNEYCKNEKRLDVCRNCQNRGFSRSVAVSDEIARHDLADWRDRFGRVLSRAAKVIAPSQAAADVLRSYYPTVRIDVEPHRSHQHIDRSFQTQFAQGERLRVSILGAIAKNKGSELLLELARLIRRDRLPIDLTVLGYTDLGEDAARQDIAITGPYQPDQISRLLAEKQTSLVLIPSVWPETFSYTTLEALSAGYPVLCFDMGGSAEQVRRTHGGWIVEECSAAALVRELRRICFEREEILTRAEMLGTSSSLEEQNRAAGRTARAII
ncbi:MAG: glycosyltransferase [Bdellovibrionota bacterium]